MTTHTIAEWAAKRGRNFERLRARKKAVSE